MIAGLMGSPFSSIATTSGDKLLIGKVSQKASKETGLAAGTPVISCAADAIMSFLSVGGLNVGDSIFMYGITGCWGLITDTPIIDPRFINTYYTIPNTYVSVGGDSCRRRNN
jgi:xylulokinase